MAMDRFQMDMCRGPLFKQIVIFSIPLMLSSFLQIFFNAADLIIIGRFDSSDALAAIGSSTVMIQLITTTFLGVSIGVNVLIARYLGENNRKKTTKAVHTAIAFALFFGAFFALMCIIFARPLLRLLQTPEGILDAGVLYMQLYMIGLPMTLLYNFCNAILSATGDTKRPFFYISIAGLLNILLNLFCVVVLNWSVAGVAVATVVSQAFSAIMVLRVLLNLRDSCRLKWRLLRVEWESLGKILWIGIPAGVQWMCFSFSNLLVQATVNSFGPDAIAGNTASVIWETFCFIGATAVAQTVTSFVSRNLGGKQYGRVRSSIRYCSETAAFMMGLSSFILLFFPEILLSFINSDPNVIAMGKVRFMFLAPVLLFCGTEEVFIGALRGLGHSVGPSLVMLFGICVFRIVWLLAAFPRLRTFEGLIVCYPLSWLLTFTLALIYIACLYRKLPKTDELQP